MKLCDPNLYDNESPCCPGYTILETKSFWPPPYTDEKSEEQTKILILKFIQEPVKVSAIRYKLSKKTKKVSAL